MKGGLNFGVADMEVKVMSPSKAHHNATRVGEDDACLLNILLDVRRAGTLLLENSLV